MITAMPEITGADDELLTTAEVAEKVRVTDRTLRNWAASGTGPPRIRLSWKCVRYPASGLRAWLDEKATAA